MTGTRFAMAADLLRTAQPGHGHELSVPISIGPVILRVALLAAVPALAAFAMLRAFLPAPGRAATALVTGTAAASVLLVLMLAEGVDMPRQAVLLVLVALAAPVFVVLSRDERFTTVRARVRALAPWVVSLSAALAFVEFGRAWLGAGDAATRQAMLHTGVVLALIGLSWFAVLEPGTRWRTVVVRVEAALLGNAALAASAYGIVLTLPGLTVPP